MLPCTAKHVVLPSGRVLWTEIYGSVSPSSKAILFANGMASTTNAWVSLVHSFATSFLEAHTMILHDAANTGKSAYQPDLPGPTLASLANDARALLEHLGFRSGYWIGHSFGGQQGFVAAAQAPHFWKGLLLLAPQTDRVNPITVSSMNAMGDIFSKDPETALYANEINDTLGAVMLGQNRIYGAFAREMALRQRSEGLILAFKTLLAPKEGDFAWRDMKTNIVMCFGGKDDIAPVGEGRIALSKLEGVEGAKARLVVLEKAGHWIIWEYEELMRDEIMKLIDF